jgi:hypothetical protein
MKSFIVAGLVATAAAMPQSSSGSECPASANGKFTITTVKTADSPSKRGLYSRQLSGVLTMSLKDGKLTDQAGRDGYIASNYQFQFDAPPQANAITTDGFGLCSNGSLSLDGSTVFYQCLSGNFYNLYSKSQGEQCLPIHIQAVMGAPSSGVSQIPDGQPQASTPGSAPPVTQIPDGQPQASAPATAPPVMQIPDGQPQASAPASPPVTQIPDGQPQASAPAPAPAVTQIPDGQPQAPAPQPPVTQIPDGQPQAPAPQPPVLNVTTTLIPAPATSAPAVTQISDGQPQVTAPPAPAPPATQPVNNHSATATIPPVPEFTGAATTTTISLGVLAAGFFAIFSFL